MTPDEYKKLDAIDLANLISKKEITPTELLDAALETLRDSDPSINSVVQVLEEEATQQIAGTKNGPFSGVPFLIKNLNQQIKGTTTTNGSRLYKDAVAEADTTLVERYKTSGLIIFGKTNSPEFGLATTTEPVLHGPTRNPWDTGYSPGGSSGGAAAAVATGIVPMANASDGGGSIRIPASCCGLFGLKPTRGRVPVGPFALEGWGGLSTSHAITRSVRDSALLLDHSQGAELGSPYFAPAIDKPYYETHNIAPKRCRIALCLDSFNGAQTEQVVIEACQQTAERLEGLGHRVEEARPSLNPELVRAAHGIIAVSHVGATVEKISRKLGMPIEENQLESVTWNNYLSSQAITGADYAQAVGDIHQLGRTVAAFFQEFDLILSPTMACQPPKIGELDTMSDDTDSYLELLYQMIGYTSVFNDTGHPACNLPTGINDNGLPLGVQLVASFGNEELLFQVAHEIEQEGGFQPIRPLTQPIW